MTMVTRTESDTDMLAAFEVLGPLGVRSILRDLGQRRGCPVSLEIRDPKEGQDLINLEEPRCPACGRHSVGKARAMFSIFGGSGFPKSSAAL